MGVVDVVTTTAIAVACFAIGWGIRPYADHDMATTVLSQLSSSTTSSLTSPASSSSPSSSSVPSVSSVPTTQTVTMVYDNIATQTLESSLSLLSIDTPSLPINCSQCMLTSGNNGTLGYTPIVGIAAHNSPLLGRFNNTRVRRLKRTLVMNGTLPFVLVADLDHTSNRHCRYGI
jgi:hypothetical protein